MKHVTLMENEYGNGLMGRVESWIEEHEAEILEVIDIDYQQYGVMYTAIITYEEKK